LHRALGHDLLTQIDQMLGTMGRDVHRCSPRRQAAEARAGGGNGSKVVAGDSGNDQVVTPAAMARAYSRRGQRRFSRVEVLWCQ